MRKVKNNIIITEKSSGVKSRSIVRVLYELVSFSKFTPGQGGGFKSSEDKYVKRNRLDKNIIVINFCKIKHVFTIKI